MQYHSRIRPVVANRESRAPITIPTPSSRCTSVPAVFPLNSNLFFSLMLKLDRRRSRIETPQLAGTFPDPVRAVLQPSDAGGEDKAEFDDQA